MYSLTTVNLNTVSWLDHCVSSKNAHKLIEKVIIIHEYVVSDQFPLAVYLKCEVGRPTIDNYPSRVSHGVQWLALSPAEKHAYQIHRDDMRERERQVYLQLDELDSIQVIQNTYNAYNIIHTI